jgi:hypothetical protein
MTKKYETYNKDNVSYKQMAQDLIYESLKSLANSEVVYYRRDINYRSGNSYGSYKYRDNVIKELEKNFDSMTKKFNKGKGKWYQSLTVKYPMMD